MEFGSVAPVVVCESCSVTKADCEEDKRLAVHRQNMEHSVNYPVTNVIG